MTSRLYITTYNSCYPERQYKVITKAGAEIFRQTITDETRGSNPEQSYMTDLISLCSNSNLLCATRSKTVTGSRAFRCAAETIWNSLPDGIKSACSIESFRTKLKRFYFVNLVPN